MLEDHVFVTEQTMQDKKDMLTRFLAASQKGWQDAVKDQEYAVDSVMKRADKSTTDRNHQVSMMREVAKLVQPEGLDATKVGFIDPAKFQEIANATKSGCPVSQALAATPIELEAKLV